MPTLTRWFLRSALIYLVASLAIAVVLAVPHGPTLDILTPVYFHFLMVGWVTQTIFGVAYWMFPRFSPDKPRGREHLAVVTYAGLNAGLIARAVAEPMLVLRASDFWTIVLIISAFLQWLAALTFAVNTWARVKTR
jgi:hypothetical protein